MKQGNLFLSGIVLEELLVLNLIHKYYFSATVGRKFCSYFIDILVGKTSGVNNAFL